MNRGDPRGSSLPNFDEKIKKLVEEGKRLGTVETVLDFKLDRKPLGTRQFSNDVSRLRQEIEGQNKKTLELQQEIKHATDSFRVNMPIQKPSFLSNMNVNTNNNSNSAPLPAAYGDYTVPRRATSTTEYLEKALEDSQTQVKYLTKKLEDAHETAEKQKVHFRTAVEELQMKLQETIAGRKKLVQLREREMEEQEEMIRKLQDTLKELAAANQLQEQSLADSNERIHLLEKRSQTADKALEHIRKIFSSHDKIKGRTHRGSESDRLSDISAEFLAENVERSMNETYEEIETMRNQIMQLENDICDVKQNHEHEVDMLSVKQREVAEQLKIESNERVLEEKLNTDSAMKQVYALQDELQQQKYAISAKDQELRDMEKELHIITSQFEELKGHYFDDKDSLQTKLLNVEGELTEVKQANESSKRDCERLKQQLSDSQEHFLRTNEELKSEREQRRNLWIKESESSKEINELRQQLEEKISELSSTKETISEMKAEHSTQLIEKMRETEVVERSKAERKLDEMSEEVTRLKEDLSRTKATLESSERQISDVMVERSDTLKLLQDKDQQCERMSNQFNASERKLVEITEARKSLEERWEKLCGDYSEVSAKSRQAESEREKIKLNLEEKERQLVMLQLRFDAVSSESEKAIKEVDEVKVERSKLNVELKEKSRELEEFRNQLTASEKTTSDYENRIGELIQEKNRLAVEAREAQDDNFDLKRSVENLKKDQQDSSTQLSALLEERDEMKKQMGEVEQKSKSDCEKLKKQLKQTKRNLHEAESSLKTIKSVDGRAAKIAQNMQKEVTDKRTLIDSLKSELTKALDRLSTCERENRSLKSDLEEITEKFETTEENHRRAEHDLKETKKSEKGYKLAVERLEKGLEKAAIRNSEAQETISQQEKDIAQLHIHHKMQLMNKMTAAPIPSVTETAPATIANTLYNPSVTQPTTNVAQSMLARLILNMTSQQQPMFDLTNQSQLAKKDGTSIQKPTATADDAANADIYKVLSEVRDQLAKMDKPERKVSPKKRSPTRKKQRRSKHLEEIAPEFESESSELPVVTMASDATSTGTMSFFESGTMGSTMKDTFNTSPVKLDATMGTTDGRSDRPPSPVSELLGPTDLRARKGLFSHGNAEKRSRKGVLRENSDSNSEFTSDTTADLPVANTAALKNAITNTAEDLCKQLQDRLEGLSKMGGELKQQNKMTERMIKKQDEKLQKVRGGLKFR